MDEKTQKKKKVVKIDGKKNQDRKHYSIYREKAGT